MKTLSKTVCMLLLVLVAGCSEDVDPGFFDPVIPVYLAGIESVNIDNAGQYPFVTSESVKKEAYMIGVRWVTDHAEPDGDQSITGPVEAGTYRYQDIDNTYTKRIYSNTAFSSHNPAGANVSQYFKEVTYLPAGIDEGFVLLIAPDAGVHSFKVVYTGREGERFAYDTEPITFY